MAQDPDSLPSSASPPEPKASPPEPEASLLLLEAGDVMQLLESYSSLGPSAKPMFLLVDVRETDCEGGTLATSVYLPARTLLPARAATLQLCRQAGIQVIIYFCETSQGRGPTCARWMQDYLDEVKETGITAAVLKGGLQGWHDKYGGRMMDGYDAGFWARHSP